MKFCYQLLKKCDVQAVFLITSGKQMSNSYYGYKFTKFIGKKYISNNISFYYLLNSYLIFLCSFS